MSRMEVGVVGIGVIGIGVVQALAEAGHRVVAVDRSHEILSSARHTIAENVRLQRLFRKPTTLPADQILDNIVPTTDLDSLSGASVVIENVTEKWEVKRVVYERLDAVCRKDAVLAANTSVIPIARLATLTDAPERVIGLHFMNPVPLKSVVEVIRGPQTSTATLERAAALLRTMGKEGIVVNDSPGFVSNRVLMLAINEAIRLVDERVAPSEDIDRIFTTCLGHKMGPLATADLIGLDTILFSIEALNEHSTQVRIAVSPLLVRMVADGHLGCKSGHGFYTYQGQGRDRQ